MRCALALIALAATPAFAEPADQISQTRLRADVERMVAFGTRHTLSDPTDPLRGIGAARAWAEAQLRAACPAMAIEKPETTISGARVPAPVRLVDVVAIKPGSERPGEVVILAGHIDSIRGDVMDAKGDAPGANDDGSGTALVIEAARALCAGHYAATIVFAVLSGEEQGLYGGKLLADHARARGWTVKAMLNNDIVGNSRGSDGLVDADHVRVLSEGPRANADAALTHAQRLFGGENDSPSRNLSRWLAGMAAPELAVRQIWRADRMGRGGDHLPFEEAGYPAVRFSVAVENYEGQHQNVRSEGGHSFGDTIDKMDFAYLARVTRLNVRAAAALAAAPMPPAAKVTGAVRTSSVVEWQPVAGAVRYRVYRRGTDAPGWQDMVAETAETAATFSGVRADDWFFGVSSVAADGSESPVASALPGGAFAAPVAK